HQLRGRVGRSHHRAFAYLLVPERKAMTADAEKRLEAIASLEELGAGFMLATHDLEIRGAGELLGEEQSGQIEAIGFSLYTELLERAVRAIRSGKVPDLDDTSHHGAEVELHLPALIPDDYLPDVHTRLMLYKRIATCADNDALRAMQVEMIDRFGLLPEQVKNLFAVTALKLRATQLGIRKLEFGENGGRVLFQAQPGFEPLHLIRMVQSEPKTYAFDGQDKLRIKASLPEPAQRIAAARVLLGRLHGGDAVELVGWTTASAPSSGLFDIGAQRFEPGVELFARHTHRRVAGLGIGQRRARVRQAIKPEQRPRATGVQHRLQRRIAALGIEPFLHELQHPQ